MIIDDEFQYAADQLIDVGRVFDRKGWVPATSGNFSARLDDGRLAITVSGTHKGSLERGDIMLINCQGHSLDGKQSSAETLLHTMLYRRFPHIQAVLHAHSLYATLLSRVAKDRIVLKNYELLKALPDIETHEAQVVIPIFANNQNISRLAAAVTSSLDHDDRFHAYLIAGHGCYTWGRSVAATLKQMEALEFLFECEFRLFGVTL